MPIHAGSQIMGVGKFPLAILKDMTTDEIIGLGELRDPEYTEAVTKITDQSSVNIRRQIPSYVTYLEGTIKIGLFASSQKVKQVLTGGSDATAVAGHVITKWEYDTVASAPGPYTVTISNAVVDDLIAVEMYIGSNQFIRMVEVAAGSEVSQVSYSRSGTTLTFASGDADAQMRSGYGYAGSGTTALKHVWNGDDLPNIVKLIIVNESQNAISGAKTITTRIFYRCQIVTGRNWKLPTNEKQDIQMYELEPLPKNDGTSASEDYYEETTSLIP